MYPGSIFPFLFGGTFIEAYCCPPREPDRKDFPFLFGGTFIEASNELTIVGNVGEFPFLFGGTFIEAASAARHIPVVLEISLPFRRDFH